MHGFTLFAYLLYMLLGFLMWYNDYFKIRKAVSNSFYSDYSVYDIYGHDEWILVELVSVV